MSAPSTAVAVRTSEELVELVRGVMTREQVELVKRTIAKGATDDELALFLTYVKRTGLDPLARQIFLIARREKEGDGFVTIRRPSASIDGLRVVAERRNVEKPGSYRPGPTAWCGDDEQWRDVWISTTPPRAAKVGVYKDGELVEEVARFDSYAVRTQRGELNATWKQYPDVMIAKCAEARALRRAFPHDLGGLYVAEEFQAEHGTTVIDDDRVDGPEKGAVPVSKALSPPSDRARVRELTTELDELYGAPAGSNEQTLEAYLEGKHGHGIDYLSAGEAEATIRELEQRVDEARAERGDDPAQAKLVE